MEDPLLFAAVAGALLSAPGPTNALLATGGAAAGFRRSLHLVLVSLAAYLVTILTLGGLIASLLPASGRTVLSFLAAVYLAVLAARLWRAQPGSAASTVRWHEVFVATLLNPKGLVLGLVVVPMQSERAWLYIGELSIILIVVGAAWVAVGALVRNVGGNGVGSIVPKAASAVLAVAAVALMVSSLVR